MLALAATLFLLELLPPAPTAGLRVERRAGAGRRRGAGARPRGIVALLLLLLLLPSAPAASLRLFPLFFLFLFLFLVGEPEGAGWEELEACVDLALGRVVVSGDVFC